MAAAIPTYIIHSLTTHLSLHTLILTPTILNTLFSLRSCDCRNGGGCTDGSFVGRRYDHATTTTAGGRKFFETTILSPTSQSQQASRLFISSSFSLPFFLSSFLPSFLPFFISYLPFLSVLNIFLLSGPAIRLSIHTHTLHSSTLSFLTLTSLTPHTSLTPSLLFFSFSHNQVSLSVCQSGWASISAKQVNGLDPHTHTLTFIHSRPILYTLIHTLVHAYPYTLSYTPTHAPSLTHPLPTVFSSQHSRLYRLTHLLLHRLTRKPSLTHPLPTLFFSAHAHLLTHPLSHTSSHILLFLFSLQPNTHVHTSSLTHPLSHTSSPIFLLFLFLYSQVNQDEYVSCGYIREGTILHFHSLDMLYTTNTFSLDTIIHHNTPS